MSKTIVCPKCGITLNLPASLTPGKRLKCPKCAHRFSVNEAAPSSSAMGPGLADAAQTSLQTALTNLPPLPDEAPTPRAEGPLRETFDLPSLGAADEPGSGRSGPAISDAAALFEPASPQKRRKSSAEARSQARRCTGCHGFVPAGMSVCQVCGLDQETGIRVDLDEDVGPKAPPPPPGPPMHVAIIGGICGVGGIVLVLIAAILSLQQESDVLKYGWLCLALISGFGSFAAYEFIRGKSVKMLMLALTLGVFVNAAGMIALPIFQVEYLDEAKQTAGEAAAAAPEEVGDEDFAIRSRTDLINRRLDRIYMGLIFIGIYVALSVYLMSPPVRRYMNRRQIERAPISLV